MFFKLWLHVFAHAHVIKYCPRMFMVSLRPWSPPSSYRWNFTPHQQTSFQDKNSLSLSTQTVSLYPYNFRTFRLVSSRFLGHQNDGNMLTLIYNRPKPSSFVSKRICNLRRQKPSKKDTD